MPWHLPKDLKHFKQATSGKPVIMGRRTFQSIGRPLPNRTNFVITRDQSFAADGIDVVHDLATALSKAREKALSDGVGEVMVIGGGQVYSEALPLADRIYLTEIHADINGDTRFPVIEKDKWREIRRVEENAGSDGTPACSFLLLKRVIW